ncbi:MAG: peptidoglycan editing factor PgeF [Chloroflexi bacterium AL-N5]|nr:peptidoglycan editing factor PgeF [Chloroflexi bacterium AL-N5]
MKLLQSSHLSTAHGFATRLGGVSQGVYHSLNFALSTGDDPACVERNRQMLLDAYGVNKAQVCVLEQVHSADVVTARAGWYEQKADAMMTKQQNLLLIITTADCLPILFYDPQQGAIAAAHAGWRGTAQHVCRNVVTTLQQNYETALDQLRVVIGPGISGACYQVGEEVVAAFRAAGYPEQVFARDAEGGFRLDLKAANRWELLNSGVSAENIQVLEHCTFSEAERFYSHRRDGLRRGSHWSVIKLG